MTIDEYINQQLSERQQLMHGIHNAIITNDKAVTPVIEAMMGKEMIIYKEKCYMKYGLSGVKNHMSLHCMPMYMDPALHEKYAKLLPGAKFQKGCINFTNGDVIPIAIMEKLFTDCAAINIADVLENRKKKKA